MSEETKDLKESKENESQFCVGDRRDGQKIVMRNAIGIEAQVFAYQITESSIQCRETRAQKFQKHLEN